MRRSTPLLAALALAAGAVPARAIPAPDVVAEVGQSFAVDSSVDGVFDQGGFSLALSALWPLDRLRTGVLLFADDLGSRTQEMVDDSQNPPVPLGTFYLAHAGAYGGAWRLEIDGPRLRRFDTFVRGDWGVYRFRADQYGTVLQAETKLGWSLGGGLMLPVSHAHSFGITFSFDRVFHDFFRDYMSAAFAWHWRPGRASHATGPGR